MGGEQVGAGEMDVEEMSYGRIGAEEVGVEERGAETRKWPADVALPALLGAGRRPYGRAINAALEAAGFDDLPRRGSFVIGSVERGGLAMSSLAGAMGMSKQAASQLVDTLVTRGYLDRSPDPVDRRRMTVALTERGQAAAVEIRSAVASVDAALTAIVGEPAIAQARRVLGVLSGLDV
jgi:DNA-binding MarR family transcriptional regulator